MAYWIHIVVIFQSLTNVEGALYVSEKPVSSDEAASMCNLTTPDIHYHAGGNNVLLDGSNFNIAEGESVWSGYVQTYAAFLYEGCYQEEFVNSSAKHTNMYMDPGECYSRCKTDVIGMQTTTCHCNPRPREAKLYATGCDSICSNPDSTVCGGSEAVSIYSKVQYPGSGASSPTDNCRAFYWKNRDIHFYTWRNCSSLNHIICQIDSTASTKYVYYWYWSTYSTWIKAAEWCVSDNRKPFAELLLSGYPKFNLTESYQAWIGQIRSHVIGNDEDSNYKSFGWRRGVITKSGGDYSLNFHTTATTLKSLCENVSTSPPPSDSTYKTTQSTDLSSTTTTTTPTKDHHDSERKSNTDESPQFPMTVVYVAVPVVLVLVAVIVFVILCKRRHASKKRMLSPGVHQDVCVTNPSCTTNDIRDPGMAVVATRGDEYAVVMKKTKLKQTVTIDDNEYDPTVTFSSLKYAETDNTYNRLDDVTGNTSGHIGEGGGNEVDIYDHAVSKDKPLKASKGRNTFQNDRTVTFSSLKHTATDDTYNRLNDVTFNTDTHETNGGDVDLYDHAVSNDKPLKASKKMNTGQDGLYDTASAVNRPNESQTSADPAFQDIYAQTIPRSQRK